MTESQFWIALREYPGGILQFERDFQTEFVNRTEQSRTPQADDRIFTGVVPRQSVYAVFAREQYTITDVDTIGYLNTAERINELHAYGLAPEDFDRWYTYVVAARQEGMLTKNQSEELFSDVMKRIFLVKKLSTSENNL